MLCEKCGVKNATTHIRTVVNGTVYERHLCSKCAISEEYADAGSLNKILGPMLENMPVSHQKEITRCACCGSSLADILNSGKCGCAECYSTFYEQLIPYIKKSQYGRNVHKGKAPKSEASVVKSSADKIEELKSLLKKLVSDEQYEEAALVRDKIKLLEGKMQ